MSMFTTFWKLHGDKILSISKGAGVAALGAAISYALPIVTALNIPARYIPVEVAVISIIVNTLRKFGVPIVYSLVKGE